MAARASQPSVALMKPTTSTTGLLRRLAHRPEASMLPTNYQATSRTLSQDQHRLWRELTVQTPQLPTRYIAHTVAQRSPLAAHRLLPQQERKPPGNSRRQAAAMTHRAVVLQPAIVFSYVSTSPPATAPTHTSVTSTSPLATNNHNHHCVTLIVLGNYCGI